MGLLLTAYSIRAHANAALHEGRRCQDICGYHMVVRGNEAKGKPRTDDMAGMNPEFNVPGTSTKEKAERAQRVLDAAIENLKIATGVTEVTGAMVEIACKIAEAKQYRDHFAAQVEKAERERKAREEAQRKAEALQRMLSDVMAKIGTSDPDKVMAAIRAAGLATSEAK
jgi:hypothetical protein